MMWEVWQEVGQSTREQKRVERSERIEGIGKECEGVEATNMPIKRIVPKSGWFHPSLIIFNPFLDRANAYKKFHTTIIATMKLIVSKFLWKFESVWVKWHCQMHKCTIYHCNTC